MEFEHGTMKGYRKAKCRCAPCTTANRERMSKLREAFRSYPADRIPHGVGGYRNYSCRCAVCCEAHSVALKDTRARRRDDLEGLPHGTASGFYYWGCHCGECFKASQAEAARRKAIDGDLNNQTRETARRYGDQWTGPELELLARTDLTLKEKAVMLGRTWYAVRTMRTRLRVEPMLDHVAGVAHERVDD